jgi:hypothetical protein
MLLSHETTYESFLNILKENKLTSNKINKNVRYGWPNYENDYVYFTVVKSRNRKCNAICIYFNSTLLLNKKFILTNEWEPIINSDNYKYQTNINTLITNNQIAIKTKVCNIKKHIYAIKIRINAHMDILLIKKLLINFAYKEIKTKFATYLIFFKK